MNKVDKPLARLTRGHKDSIQINKMRNEEGDIYNNGNCGNSKISSDPTTKTYIQQNWKIWMKWTIF